MKKISSKIIISLVLAVFLWSGFTNVHATTTPNTYNWTPIRGLSQEDTNAVNNKCLGVRPDSAYQTCLKNETAAAKVAAIDKACGTDKTTARYTECVAATKKAANPLKVNNGWENALSLVPTMAAKVADVWAGLMSMPAYGIAATWLLIIGGIVNALTFIAAMLFDAVLILSMQSFSTIVTTAGVNEAWEIIRNVINISFIFILLYTAISIILGSFGPQKKSTVAGVVISALLINFSLFIARVVIDFGNILALAIYNKTWSGPGFSTLMMQGLQLQTLFSPDVLTATGQTNALVMTVIQIVLSSVFMWVLLYGVIFMVGRLVALIALLALSPIGFIGFSMPWLKDKADEWWSALLNQVFLLPIFLFFLMMSATMLKASFEMVGIMNSSFIDANQATNFKVGMWVYFSLIIGMLLMSIKMTKKMSGNVGKIVDAVGKGVKIAAAAAIAIGASVVTGGAAVGPATALVGRMAGSRALGGLVGRAGTGIQNIARSGIGQSIQRTGATAANMYADPGTGGIVSRSIVKNLLSGVKTHTGIDIAAANKDVNDAQKDYLKYAGEQANKIGPAKTIDEMKRRNDTMDNIEGRAKDRISNDADGKALTKTLKETSERLKDLTNNITEIDHSIKTETDPAKKTALEAQKKTIEQERDEAKETVKTTKAAQEIRERKLIDGMKKQIGQEMGYNTETHEAEMEALEKEKAVRETAKDEYLNNLSEKGYRGKKAAEALRAVKGKYQEKSMAEKLVEDLEKQIKSSAKKEEKKDDEGGDEKKK